MISSNNAQDLIRYLSDVTLHIIFDAEWVAMNLRSKHPVAWNNSGHVPLWHFHWHFCVEDTSSPGIICIVCHQVLSHPSEHGTSSMGKDVQAKAHIAKLNEFTESEVSELTCTTIDEIALAILERQGSRGITIVSSLKKFIFHSLILPVLTQLTDSTLKTSSKGLPNCCISPRYLQSVPNVKICFRLYSAECYFKPPATTVIECVTRWACTSIRQHP